MTVNTRENALDVCYPENANTRKTLGLVDSSTTRGIIANHKRIKILELIADDKE
jgi:hypothetical protein